MGVYAFSKAASRAAFSVFYCIRAKTLREARLNAPPPATCGSGSDVSLPRAAKGPSQGVTPEPPAEIGDYDRVCKQTNGLLVMLPW
jgi:hypothetical protein